MVAAVAADEPTLPLVSQAWAVKVTGPFAHAVVFQLNVYGAVVTVASSVVLAQNSTLAMAIASVAVALRVTVPTSGLAGTVSVTTGAAPRTGGAAPRSIRPYQPLA